MAKAEKRRILFSPVGGSDPICGMHDGSMLHIVRHYRPDKILWYISDEMKKAEAEDNRYNRSIEMIKNVLPDYDPEILPPYYDDIKDVSDFDGFYNKFLFKLRDLLDKYPDYEIIVNVSSGTPQMKMALAMLTVAMPSSIKAVQVKNYTGRARDTKNNLDSDYDLDAEWELNEDNCPEAENRCHEPGLFDIHLERQRTQANALSRRYDYDALLQMKDTFSPNVYTLISHLAARSVYNLDDAKKYAEDIEGFEPYPYPVFRKGSREYNTCNEYIRLAEYLLSLRLMERTQRYTDLVIRLNPFVVQLQRAWLIHKNIDLSAMTYIKSYTKEEVFSMDKIQKEDPDFANALNMASSYSADRPLSIWTLNLLIKSRGLENTEGGKLFKGLEELNLRRNASAHTLTSVKPSEFNDILGMGSAELIRRLQKLLEEIYPEYYHSQQFSVYEDANKYIMQSLTPSDS